MIEQLQELGVSPDAQALAQGMLLGDKSALDPTLIQSMRTAGMSHLLAVSGMHVGIIMTILWLLLTPVEWLVLLFAPVRMAVHYWIGGVKRLLVIAVTSWYVWRIGAPPSAVRAAVMLSILLIGWIVQRPSVTWRSLLFAALCLLAWDPWSIASPGFQLSFLAVAGILLFAPWLNDETLPRWMRLVLLSVAAQWLTAPFVAYWFHQLPVFGWLQGLLVVPLLPLMVGFYIAGMAFPGWHWLAYPIEALTAWTVWIADVIGSLERLLLGGHVYLYPEWWDVVWSEMLLLAIIVYLRNSKLNNSPTALNSNL